MNCGSNNCGCSEASVRDQATGAQSAPTYRPTANVTETTEAYQVSLEVPGSSNEGIDVQVHEGVLTVVAKVAPRVPEGVRTIASEFGVGDYRREFRMGEDIDADGITASYDAGVLSIMLPKARKAQPRRVPVGNTGRTAA